MSSSSFRASVKIENPDDSSESDKNPNEDDECVQSPQSYKTLLSKY